MWWRASKSGEVQVHLSPASAGSAPGQVDVSWRVGTSTDALPHRADRLRSRANRWFAGDSGLSKCDDDVEAPSLQAAACYAQAAEIATSSGQRARWWYQQADALRSANRLAKSVPRYDSAIEALSRVADDEWLAAALQARGWTYSRLGSLVNAQEDFDAAIALLESLLEQDPTSPAYRYDYADGRNNRCIVDQRAGRLDEAERCFERNAALAERLKYPPFTSQTLNGLGFLARMRGDVRSAVSALEAAVARARESGATLEESAALNTLGFTWQLAGEFEKAVDQYRAALSLFEAAGDETRAAIALGNLGTLYRGLGDLPRAKDAQERAMAMHVALGDEARVALARSNLGTIAFEQGDYQTAANLHGAALEVWSGRGSVRRTFRAHTHLLNDYLGLGDLERAAFHYSAARPLADSIDDRAAVADFWLAAGEFALRQGERAEARNRFGTALEEFDAMALGPGRLRSLYGLSRAAAAEGDLERALDEIEQALTALESMRPRLLSLTGRAAYSSARHQIYQLAVDLRMRSDGDQNRNAALRIAERSKSAAQTSLIAAPGVFTDDPEYTQRVHHVSLRHGELLSAADDAEQFVRRRAAYFEALSALEDYERGLNRELQPAGSAFHQGGSVGTDEAKLTFFIGKEQVYAWLESAGNLTSSVIGDADEVLNVVRRAVESLHAASPDGGRTELAAASDLLLPLLDGLEPGRSLTISPDGALHLLSFAALRRQRSGVRRPLIEDHEIVYGNGFAKLAEDTVAPSSALVVADPVFASSDSGSVRPGLLLTRLPGTRREVEPILDHLGADAVTALMGHDANRAGLLAATRAGHGLIHLATHGIFDDRVPAGSGLALSRSSAEGTPVEWFVNVHDIARLDLRADLVTLSGCDTARGTLLNGTGLVGLTRAFLQAGARRVMSSLWAVSDRATRELMQAFYDSYLEAGLRPAAALRRAQLDIAGRQGWRDPYYWAGFAIIRN